MTIHLIDDALTYFSLLSASATRISKLLAVGPGWGVRFNPNCLPAPMCPADETMRQEKRYLSYLVICVYRLDSRLQQPKSAT